MTGTRLSVFGLILLSASLAGCGSSGVQPTSAEHLRQVAAEHSLDPEQVASPLEVTPEMRAWVEETVRGIEPTLEQLRRILDQFSSEKGLDLKYVPGHTGTASEVFETRTYNCLSFSHLFVALARELGIDAYFLNVQTVQNFRKEGDLVVVSGHVTVGYGAGPNRKVLEFTVGPEVDYRTAEQITDLEALAMYYSNRGAELLRRGENEEAKRWLELAVDLEPHYADAWVNLGVARRRVGNRPGAEEAYRTAIELEPGEYSAYSNLSTLLRLTGDPDAAREVLLLLDRRDNRDPFIYLALGDDAMRQEQLEDARRYYRRAQNLSSLPETNAAMGLWALESGDRQEARRWLRKAREGAPQHERVEELARKLEANS